MRPLLLALVLLAVAPARAQGKPVADPLALNTVPGVVLADTDVLGPSDDPVATVSAGDTVRVVSVALHYVIVELADRELGRIPIERVEVSLEAKETLSGQSRVWVEYQDAYLSEVRARLQAVADSVAAVERTAAEAAVAEGMAEEYRRTGVPVRIMVSGAGRPNSAGGVGYRLSFRYIHPRRTLRYLRVRVRPYNRVGDPQVSEIGGRGQMTLSLTGPYDPLYGDETAWWENVWYNHDISCARIERVEVEYVEGGMETFTNVGRLLDGASNSCTLEAQRR